MQERHFNCSKWKAELSPSQAPCRKAGTLPAALIKPLANTVPTHLHGRPFQMRGLMADLHTCHPPAGQDRKKSISLIAGVWSQVPATVQVLKTAENESTGPERFSSAAYHIYAFQTQIGLCRGNIGPRSILSLCNSQSCFMLQQPKQLPRQPQVEQMGCKLLLLLKQKGLWNQEWYPECLDQCRERNPTVLSVKDTSQNAKNLLPTSKQDSLWKTVWFLIKKWKLKRFPYSKSRKKKKQTDRRLSSFKSNKAFTVAHSCIKYSFWIILLAQKKNLANKHIRITESKQSEPHKCFLITSDEKSHREDFRWVLLILPWF